MKTKHKGYGLVLGVLWLLMANLTATADMTLPSFGVFNMLEGQGIEVCEACLKALESLPSDLSGCERNYDPAFGFEIGPFWEEIDPLKHLALLKQVMMFVIPPDPERGIAGTIYDGNNFKREIRRLMKQERIGLVLTQMNIDNDARPDFVLKFRHGRCGDPHLGPGSATFQVLLVLKSDQKEIDLIKTEVMMRNNGKRSGHPAGNVFSQIYDAFNHKGQSYFDRWDNDVVEPDTFSVYRAKADSVNRFCGYRYEHRYRSQGQGGP